MQIIAFGVAKKFHIMTEIPDLIKCPGCHRKGTMELFVRKKIVESKCIVCGEIVTSRVPYPKHRADHEGYQYHFQIPSVRPIRTHENDELTCSQEEWEERKS